MGAKDKAFRRLLGDKQIFIRFLRNFVRQDLPYTIDPDRLRLEDVVLENISFIPPDLTEELSDVLYRIRAEGKETYIYVLVEHQSKVDYLMPYRLLSYMMRIWARCVEKAGEKKKLKSFLLPPIYPIVFYEGERHWTAARNFTEKVERSEDFRGYVPDFSYRLISLNEKPPEELLAFKDALGGLLYLATPAKEEKLLGALEKIHQLLGELPLEEGKLLANHFLGYWKILAEKEGIRHEDDLLSEHFEHEGAEEMITYLQREIRTIKQEGLQEGRRKERLALAAAMLRKGMGLSLVAELTEIPEEKLRELEREIKESGTAAAH